MRLLKLLVTELFWPIMFVLVLALGMTACVKASAKAETPVQTVPELTRLKTIEAGGIYGGWSPTVYILEDTQTGEHYALARYQDSVSFTKLSK